MRKAIFDITSSARAGTTSRRGSFNNYCRGPGSAVRICLIASPPTSPPKGVLPGTGGLTRVVDKRHVYASPADLKLNDWALSGDWTVQKQLAALNAPNGRITYRFHARDLHLVMGPGARGAPVRFRVLVDGQAPRADRGIDVDEQGNGTLTEQRLYQLIRQRKPVVDRQFEIEFLDPGAEAFVFTFG